MQKTLILTSAAMFLFVGLTFAGKLPKLPTAPVQPDQKKMTELTEKCTKGDKKACDELVVITKQTFDARCKTGNKEACQALEGMKKPAPAKK